MTVEGFISSAIRNGKALRIKYYPNKIANRELTGWRYVLPFKMSSRGGIKYLLAWFVGGSSDLRTFGYRLYIVSRIQSIEFTIRQNIYLYKSPYQGNLDTIFYDLFHGHDY